MSDKVIIYSDGGADPNPGIGGWAAVLRFGEEEKVLTGNNPHTTNSRMELQAAVAALGALKRPCQVVFYTDSEYLRQGITKWIDVWAEAGWVRVSEDQSGKKRKQPLANKDLWQALRPLAQRHDIEWHWVKGHAGDAMNERVDVLARQARLEITPTAVIDENAPRLYLRASCRGNPGPGGWGVVLEIGDETEQSSGSVPATTNNRMELTAVIEGLLLLPLGSQAQIFTMSDYLYQGATRWIQGWRQRDWQKKGGQPVANADLWQALDELMAKYAVKWVNAKGTDLPALQEASKLATEAIEIV